MKDWWINLSLRERQILSFGGLFVGLFLLYELLWSPLSDEVTQLRNKVKENNTLLIWMEQTNLRIRALAKVQTGSDNATSSLLSTVQSQLNKSTLNKHVRQLRQSESDSVQLTLTNVDFDLLITWLMQLGQTNNVIVTQISVQPSGGPGVVGADIILKRG